MYKKLNGKSSPLKSGFANPNFSKFNKGNGAGFGNKGKKGKKAKDGEELAEDDEIGHKLRNEKAERNQNFQRQDLNKKYEGKTLGKANFYKTHFMPNGRSKAFYRKLDKEEELGNEHQTHKDVEEEFLYNKHSKFNFVKDGLLSDDCGLVTKENAFFKMINKGMSFLMMSRLSVPSNYVETFDRTIAELYQSKDYIGADRLVEAARTLSKISGETQGENSEYIWRKSLKAIFGHEDFYAF